MRALRIVLSTTAVAAVTIAVAAIVWWFLLRGSPQLATTAPAIPADLETSISAWEYDSLAYAVIAERSEVAFFADASLSGVSIASTTVKEATNDIGGVLCLTNDGLALDPDQTSVLTVGLGGIEVNGVSASSLEATFAAKEITGYDASIAEGDEQTLLLAGTLQILGIEEELIWEVKARRLGKVLTVLATAGFDYTDFDIPAVSAAGPVSVDDDVTLQVQLVALVA